MIILSIFFPFFGLFDVLFLVYLVVFYYTNSKKPLS